MTERSRYVLVTAACNEGEYIGGLIHSVISQDQRPERWVIVSDNSDDRTDYIIREYSKTNDFIRLHRITTPHARNFAAQVHAINAGLSLLQNYDYDYVGNLDADITLPSDYFANLMARFREDPRLGIGGGYLYERSGRDFKPRDG